MNKLISVVIPIYNVEKYINESVNSLINQTIGFENIEVVLVDDCSTDKSGEIAKEYANKYSNIIYYRLPENSGMAGRPRNIGIKLASAKYIMFLDSDDYFYDYALKTMYDVIKKDDYIFATSNFCTVTCNKKIIDEAIINRELYSNQEVKISDYINTQKILKPSSCLKIINREFLIKNNIEFLEGIPGEDAYFTNNLMLHAKKCYYVSTPIVCYRQRDKEDLSETHNLNKSFFIKMIRSNTEIYELFFRHNELKCYNFYYVPAMIFMLKRLILSFQMELKEKVEILNLMDELLKYMKQLKIDLKNIKDELGILEIFKNLDNKEDYILNMEKRMQNISNDEYIDMRETMLEQIMNELL